MSAKVSSAYEGIREDVRGIRGYVLDCYDGVKRCQCCVRLCDVVSHKSVTYSGVLVHVCRSSVPGQQSGQSPDLDPGPALLESFLESRVVQHVAARSLY